MAKFTKLFVVLYFVIFCIISKIIFINVYDTAGYIVDELFHVPQGLSFCQLYFNRWDPKITTLPGLYLVSTALLAPINFCTLYGLRLTNLIAAVINVPLFISLFHLEYDGPKTLSWAATLSGISLSILPPLYFFSHLYYTDTLSVTTVLIMLLLSKKKYHIFAALMGSFSIIVRQTNVIFVAMIFGEQILDIFVNIMNNKKYRSKKPKTENNYDFFNVYYSLRKFFRSGFEFRKLKYENIKIIFSYFTILLAFSNFVYMNGGIVVGDKTAHTATINFPQVFYFSLFCIVFALPHFALEIIPFVKYVYNKKLLCFVYLTTALCIVHFNTLVHPYLLADNRHYTFYIWNRIYSKYFFSKYILVFVYMFSIYAAIKRTDPIKNFGFILIYIPVVILLLVPQKLLDVRYFLMPYILLRLKFKTRNNIILISEFLLYLLINYATFHIFFTKEIFWKDFEEAQRLIW